MINKPNDWDNVKAASTAEREKLPAGGYEAKIIGAKVVPNSNGTQRLEIAVDVAAGEFRDYFKNDFDNNPYEDKKWRGVARFFLPQDNGERGDDFKKRLLKAMAEALEKSNSEYKWNWDESKLKGLKTGIMVRDKEYDVYGDGKVTGLSPEIFEFVDIKIIREGNFKIPKPKYLNGKGPSAPEAPMPSDNDAPPESGDDYPF